MKDDALELTLLILDSARLNSNDIIALLERIQRQRETGGLSKKDYIVLREKLYRMHTQIQVLGESYKKKKHR